MKTNYILNFLLAIAIFTLASQTSDAQIRMIEVDPATNTVKIRNYGSTTVDLTSYWFCHLFTYTQLGSGTVQSGSLNLGPGQDVVVTASSNFNDASSDLGLYQTSSFGSTTSMQDFVQWGTFGQGRENIAAMKGIWTAGSFINVSPPYQYNGDGNQNGFQFWDTLLGISDFNLGLNLKLYPNPSDDVLNITLQNSEANLGIQLYDILGKLVIQKTINTTDLAQIDVSELKEGLYLVKFTIGDSTETKRFIKN
ncbi:T9SS type A sorting domain-containing protein [Psychroserpens mesophilus]|uniref:T9SS type A sorting domain-containing protein n=1 Tax=Psychroserpens mesophilus TaxID=325473 RepID=UPI00058C80F1|nr:T9SS type A sorting domain-containing protein [Psychroserpens mesophilus]